MNRLLAAGVYPDAVPAVELARLIEARDTVPRSAFADAIASSSDPGFRADSYLAEAAVSDEGSLVPIVNQVIMAHPGEVKSYRAGKHGLLGFFVGQVMKQTGGKANAKVVNDLLRDLGG